MPHYLGTRRALLAAPVAAVSTLAVSNQAFGFGALTLANAGGVTPSATGGTITSASISSGDSSNHWTIGSDGTFVPSSTGDSANLSGSPYTLVCSYNGGAATATHTITATANAYSVLSTAELIAAVADAAANHASTDTTVKVRDNVNIQGDGSNNINLNGYVFSGTIVDANAGANEGAYSRSATASFTGGSCKITADTAYSPQISGKMIVQGTDGLWINGLRFTAVPTSDAYNRAVGNADTTSVSTFYQLTVLKNGTYTTPPKIIVSGNRFGGNAVNSNPLRWGQAIFMNIAETAIVEDNEFDGFYIGLSFSSVRRAVSRRNAFQNQTNDAIRALGNASTDLTSFTSMRCEFTDNVIWNLCADTNWAGAHSDGIQFGTGTDNVVYLFAGRACHVQRRDGAALQPGHL